MEYQFKYMLCGDLFCCGLFPPTDSIKQGDVVRVNVIDRDGEFKEYPFMLVEDKLVLIKDELDIVKLSDRVAIKY